MLTLSNLKFWPLWAWTEFRTNFNYENFAISKLLSISCKRKKICLDGTATTVVIAYQKDLITSLLAVTESQDLEFYIKLNFKIYE